MCGVVFPPAWLFGLRWPSTGAYRLFGGANGGLWEGFCQWALLRIAAASVCPLSEPRAIPTTAGDPPTLAGRSGLASYVVTAFFSWVLVHTRLLCVPPYPQEWSLCFPQSCGTPAILLSFKVRLSGDLSSCYQTPRLGSLMQDSEPSLQWENFCGIIVFQFVGHLPGRYWIWFYCYALSGLSFIFVCRISFLAGSSIFPSMVAQQLVVIPVLLQEGVWILSHL